MTMYREHPYGELFDLSADPEERCNRWDDPASAPSNRMSCIVSSPPS